MWIDIPFLQSRQPAAAFKIGEADNRSSLMGLAPASYEDFLAHDFGWEDRYFLVGHSQSEEEWPYVLPGPEDRWGGTGPTSGYGPTC